MAFAQNQNPESKKVIVKEVKIHFTQQSKTPSTRDEEHPCTH